MSPGEIAALHHKFDALSEDVVGLKVDVATIKASMLTTPKLVGALVGACAIVGFLITMIEKVGA